jgi:hypothetical protein
LPCVTPGMALAWPERDVVLDPAVLSVRVLLDSMKARSPKQVS